MLWSCQFSHRHLPIGLLKVILHCIAVCEWNWREESMSRKSSKKPAQTPVPGPESTPAGTAYPADQAELNAQNARLKKAAAAGAGALKSSATSAEPPSTAVPDAKPSTMLETLKPQSAVPKAPPVQTVERAPQSQSPGSATAPPPAPVRAQVSPSGPPAPPKQNVAPATSPPGQSRHATHASDTVDVTFVLLEPAAKHVSVRGEFNGWSAEATPLTRHDDGHWETSVPLSPGRYEYKFFVDGQWVPDPRASENVWNPHGTLNSVLVV